MINLELSDELKQMRDNMREFAKSLFRPISRKYDENEHAYPEELDVFRGSVTNTRRSGGEKVSPGKSDERIRQAVLIEEFACGDVGLMMSIPNQAPGNPALSALASDKQFEKFGGKWTAFSITEPETGSDSGSVSTTAKLEGDEWVLNGEKIFVTAAERCDNAVVWATIDKDAGKAGIKPFLVEKGTPGFSVAKLEKKMGVRASDTGSFVFTDCRIPRENILGSPEVKAESKESFKNVMKSFDNIRPSIGAMATGLSRAILEFTGKKLKEKGCPLDYGKNPNNISSMEKEYYMMEAAMEASRLLSWRACWMSDSNLPNSLEASMCKAKGGRAVTLITQKCCELLGPLGYSAKELAEKWMRDAKVLDIFEGTGQIQHLIIARNILKLTSKELK